jgi:hypothetical protein
LVGQVGDYACALADAIEKALPHWVEGSVARIMTAWAGGMPDDVAAAARSAGARAQAEVGPTIRSLLLADIDEQATTPLAILRSLAVRYPTDVLHDAGVPPVQRDQFVEEVFPDDTYDLAPASFTDLDPELRDVAVAWGAAKAFEHKRRHAAS